MSTRRPDTLLDDIMGEHPDESALLDFSSGILGVAAADALVAHLDTCSRCRQMLSSLTRSSSDAIEMLGDEPDFPTRVGVDVLVGQVLGEYRVLERINQGGMGVLYRGEHQGTKKAVAIKVLLPEIAADPNQVHRLLGEARAVNSIRHENIIDIFFLGQLPDGRHYMVMDLLEGSSLSDMLRERGRLQPAEVHVVLEQAMAALHAAHGAGVIHRDLKPENIFVNPLPQGWKITLLDFGLAKQQGTMSQLTAPNMVLGTPGYMAPEQIRGQEATSAIDIYAMGICAWALLTGREPYSGGSIVEVMKRHLDSPVPTVRTHVPGVPIGLEALIVKMMAKDPAGRPTADEVRKTLGRMKNDPRRFTQSQDLTQLVQPETVPEGVSSVPPAGSALPVTVPEGVKPVPAAATNVDELPATLKDVKRPDPSLLKTTPDRYSPKTVSEAPGPLAYLAERKVPLLMAAIGLALMGGAVGLLFTKPPPPPPDPVEDVGPVESVEPVVELPTPPPDPIVEVDPPRPNTVSRAEVERSLQAARAKAATLSPPAARQSALQQLGKLGARLRKNEQPGSVALDLEKLVKELEL